MPKKQIKQPLQTEPSIKDFLDMIAQSMVKFNIHHFIFDEFKSYQDTENSLYTIVPTV